jgi:hypothetical protein
MPVNDRYRKIQTLKNLYDDSNGKEITGNRYDFTGKVLQNRQKQTFGGLTATVDRYYTYAGFCYSSIDLSSQIMG